MIVMSVPEISIGLKELSEVVPKVSEDNLGASLQLGEKNSGAGWCGNA